MGEGTGAAGFCPRCGSVVGVWHTRPQCDAAYDRAYRVASGSRDRHVRANALLEAADLIAGKDHRDDMGDDPHSTGWRHALNEAEHDLRQRALAVLDEAEGIRR